MSISLGLGHSDILGARGAHVPARVVLELSDQVLQVPDPDGSTLWSLVLLVVSPLSAELGLVDLLGGGSSLALVLVLLQRAQVPGPSRRTGAGTLGSGSL